MASNLELLNSGDYSDFALRCDDYEYRLHRAVVCPQSTVFAKALKGPYKVGNTSLLGVVETL